MTLAPLSEEIIKTIIITVDFREVACMDVCYEHVTEQAGTE